MHEWKNMVVAPVEDQLEGTEEGLPSNQSASGSCATMCVQVLHPSELPSRIQRPLNTEGPGVSPSYYMTPRFRTKQFLNGKTESLPSPHPSGPAWSQHAVG